MEVRNRKSNVKDEIGQNDNEQVDANGSTTTNDLTNQNPLSKLNIAIVGAGPSGLMLARLLTRHGFGHVTVFECDEHAKVRSQGGTLDLHAKRGLAAIEYAGLADEFYAHARYEGEALKVMDKNLRCYVKINPQTKKSNLQRPEIDREDLRNLLLDSLPHDVVQWGKKLTEITDQNVMEDDPKTVVLHFQDGSQQTGFDLIVGADGARSKIREFLTDEKPHYSGISGYMMVISDAKNKHPDLYSFCNQGSVFAYSDNKNLSCQQLTNGNLSLSVWFREAEHVVRSYTAKSDYKSASETGGYSAKSGEWRLQQQSEVIEEGAEAKLAMLADQFEDWHPVFRECIMAADASQGILFLPLYECRCTFQWPHRIGVTMMGDAAHLMTPFAGEGVNSALLDALIFTRMMEENDDLDLALRKFETAMHEAAGPILEKTIACGRLSMNPRALWFTIDEWAYTAYSDAFPPFLRPVLHALSRVYFTILRVIFLFRDVFGRAYTLEGT